MKQYYANVTRLEMEQINKEEAIVLIPLGALEQHGNQAPLGTDYFIANTMAQRIFDQFEDTFPLLVFPTMPIGLSTEHKHFCGSITYKPMTYYAMLYDICASLAHHGFQKVVLLVCHGGNAPTTQMISREIRSDFGMNVFVLQSGAFDYPRVQATISKGNTFDFHGGEMETSMVMAIDENLVHLETCERGHIKNQAFETHLSWLGEDFVTEDGKPIGIGGDPSGATKEKGEIIFQVSVEHLIDALRQIRQFH